MTWSGEDLMIVAGSRFLQDNRVVFAGVGAPLLASVVAQHLHAPRLAIVLEGGYIDPKMVPGRLPISTNEMRGAHGSVMLTGINDVFLLSQRGAFDYGFVGAAQVDRYGNVNTSFIGPVDAPKVRLPGSGGANDIVSSCREVLIITRHEQRRLVAKVDFVTSPGYLSGGDARENAGLVKGGPVAVITDLAILGFDPESKRMRLDRLQPGATVEQVVEATGFELIVPKTVGREDPPTEDELAALAHVRGEQDEREPAPASGSSSGRSDGHAKREKKVNAG